MATGHKVENKRKQAENLDLPLYLLTTGPARNVWTMMTVANELLVELIPVFDSEQLALSLLTGLKDKNYQAASIPLSKLQALIQDRNAFFILNPKAEVQGGEIFLREGPNWKLTFEQLNNVLTPISKKGERK